MTGACHMHACRQHMLPPRTNKGPCVCGDPAPQALSTVPQGAHLTCACHPHRRPGRPRGPSLSAPRRSAPPARCCPLRRTPHCPVRQTPAAAAVAGAAGRRPPLPAPWTALSLGLMSSQQPHRGLSPKLPGSWRRRGRGGMPQLDWEVALRRDDPPVVWRLRLGGGCCWQA